MSAETDEVIYMITCLLLDPFQLYIGMSFVFGLSTYKATASSCTVGNENVLLGFSWEGVREVLIRRQFCE